MRLLCELFVIGGLLYLGWDIPFRDRLPNQANPVAKTTPQTAQRTATAAVTPSGAWLRDPNHLTVLDTPAPAIAPVQPQPAASRSGSWMFDPSHHATLDAPRKSSTPH